MDHPRPFWSTAVPSVATDPVSFPWRQREEIRSWYFDTLCAQGENAEAAAVGGRKWIWRRGVLCVGRFLKGWGKYGKSGKGSVAAPALNSQADPMRK